VTASAEAPPSSERPVTAVSHRVVSAWTRFWFEPTETSTLAVVRICFGLVVLAWTLTLIPDLNAFFSPHGTLPAQPDNITSGLGAGTWGLLSIFKSQTALIVVFAATAAGAVCLTVGFATRVASIVVFLGTLSFTRRDPYIGNSGDVLIRVVSFYLMLSPAGAALSVDRWLRARDRFWEFPRRAPWALRLLQIQISLLYLAAVWDKVRAGPSWNNGTALSYVLRVKDVSRFSLPTFATDSVWINVMTYSTLAIELALAVLVWNRRLRPWVLIAGVALHLGIDYTIRVGFFSYAVISVLLAFIPAASMSRVIMALRRRASRQAA
jgi:hypothetical protein